MFFEGGNMPRVYFSINSISEAHWKTLTSGYHGLVERRPESFLQKSISRVKYLFRKKRKTDNSLSMMESSIERMRSPYPVLDPHFLLFAMLVIAYVHKGYVIGHVGNGNFIEHHDVVLRALPANTTVIGDRFSITRPIHRYNAMINDIPEYARLMKLQSLTGDASTSALLNRLTLWLYHFVEMHQYGWSMAVRNPHTNDIKILSSPFFAKFPTEMVL